MRLTKIKLIITLFLFIPFSGNQIIASDNNDNTITPTVIKLSVATRHDAVIYTKIGAAFAKSKLGQDVGITSAAEIKFSAPSTYEGFFKEMTLLKKDVAWGGGPTLFNNLALDKAISPITDTDLLARIKANISDEIAGAEMKKFNDNNELVWVASAISSFGFTVNNIELKSRGLPKPTKWEDIASTDFFTSISEFNIGMGNAPDTTSNTRIYQIILQKFGWEKGWQLIYNIAGNSKIYDGSVTTRASVISGETAVALTIDFYGVIAMNENPNTEYIVPENGSIVNGDPIALGNNPTNKPAAIAFMKYVLSQEAQSLLLDSEINRLPVRPDAFETTLGQTRPDLKQLYDSTIINEGILFDEDEALAQYTTMRKHFEFTITDVHTKLRSTWAELASAYRSKAIPKYRFDQINEEFGKPAINQSYATSIESQMNKNAAFRTEKQTKWNAFSNSKFDVTVDIIDDPYTIIETEVVNGTTQLVTQTGTVGSRSETVTDVPLSHLWLTFGITAFVLITKLIRKRKNQVKM